MLFWLSCLQIATAKAGDHCCVDFERGFKTASPRTGWTQLLLVCLTSACPKRRHPLCSAVCWLTHRSAILSRILSFPCTVWPWAGLQAVQESAGGLKNAVLCVWLNRNMKMLLKKGRNQLGNRWKTGKGKQAVTRKIAKCCRGLGQIPVVWVDLSQCSADASREQILLSDVHTRNTLSLIWCCSQIQPWWVCWTVRAQKWDQGSLLLLVFALTSGKSHPFLMSIPFCSTREKPAFLKCYHHPAWILPNVRGTVDRTDLQAGCKYHALEI